MVSFEWKKRVVSINFLLFLAPKFVSLDVGGAVLFKEKPC